MSLSHASLASTISNDLLLTDESAALDSATPATENSAVVLLQKSKSSPRASSTSRAKAKTTAATSSRAKAKATATTAPRAHAKASVATSAHAKAKTTAATSSRAKAKTTAATAPRAHAKASVATSARAKAKSASSIACPKATDGKTSSAKAKARVGESSRAKASVGHQRRARSMSSAHDSHAHIQQAILPPVSTVVVDAQLYDIAEQKRLDEQRKHDRFLLKHATEIKSYLMRRHAIKVCTHSHAPAHRDVREIVRGKARYCSRLITKSIVAGDKAVAMIGLSSPIAAELIDCLGDCVASIVDSDTVNAVEALDEAISAVELCAKRSSVTHAMSSVDDAANADDEVLAVAPSGAEDMATVSEVAVDANSGADVVVLHGAESELEQSAAAQAYQGLSDSDKYTLSTVMSMTAARDSEASSHAHQMEAYAPIPRPYVYSSDFGGQVAAYCTEAADCNDAYSSSWVEVCVEEEEEEEEVLSNCDSADGCICSHAAHLSCGRSAWGCEDHYDSLDRSDSELSFEAKSILKGYLDEVLMSETSLGCSDFEKRMAQECESHLFENHRSQDLELHCMNDSMYIVEPEQDGDMLAKFSASAVSNATSATVVSTTSTTTATAVDAVADDTASDAVVNASALDAAAEAEAAVVADAAAVHEVAVAAATAAAEDRGVATIDSAETMVQMDASVALTPNMSVQVALSIPCNTTCQISLKSHLDAVANEAKPMDCVDCTMVGAANDKDEAQELSISKARFVQPDGLEYMASASDAASEDRYAKLQRVMKTVSLKDRHLCPIALRIAQMSKDCMGFGTAQAYDAVDALSVKVPFAERMCPEGFVLKQRSWTEVIRSYSDLKINAQGTKGFLNSGLSRRALNMIANGSVKLFANKDEAFYALLQVLTKPVIELMANSSISTIALGTDTRVLYKNQSNIITVLPAVDQNNLNLLARELVYLNTPERIHDADISDVVGRVGIGGFYFKCDVPPHSLVPVVTMWRENITQARSDQSSNCPRSAPIAANTMCLKPERFATAAQPSSYTAGACAVVGANAMQAQTDEAASSKGANAIQTVSAGMVANNGASGGSEVKARASRVVGAASADGVSTAAGELALVAHHVAAEQFDAVVPAQAQPQVSSRVVVARAHHSVPSSDSGSTDTEDVSCGQDSAPRTHTPDQKDAAAPSTSKAKAQGGQTSSHLHADLLSLHKETGELEDEWLTAEARADAEADAAAILLRACANKSLDASLAADAEAPSQCGGGSVASTPTTTTVTAQCGGGSVASTPSTTTVTAQRVASSVASSASISSYTATEAVTAVGAQTGEGSARLAALSLLGRVPLGPLIEAAQDDPGVYAVTDCRFDPNAHSRKTMSAACQHTIDYCGREEDKHVGSSPIALELGLDLRLSDRAWKMMEKIETKWRRGNYNIESLRMLTYLIGPVILELLANPEVTEIAVNSDKRLFVNTYTQRSVELQNSQSTYMDALMRLLSSMLDITLTPDKHILSGILPIDGSRVECNRPPVVPNPTLVIRKHSACSLTLDRLMDLGMLTLSQYILLEHALKDRLSILVSGETGSGKTTLLSALINQLADIYPRERVICLEDTPELQPQIANCTHAYTSDSTSMSQLVCSALRQHPDRIVVGEVRGPEALDLIDALSTGHKGSFSSMHAGSPEEAVKRLGLMISRNPEAPENYNDLIVGAIDLIIQMESRPNPHIRCIECITGINQYGICVQPLRSAADLSRFKNSPND